MRKRLIVFLIYLLLLLHVVGCATVYIDDSSNNETKSDILESMRKPTKIYTQSNKLKYGADEVWVYHDYESQGDDYLFYFKDDIVVKSENITYATL